MEKMQSERLIRTVKRIYHNNESYRKKMQERGLVPGDIKSVADISKLPFTIADTSDFGILRLIVSEPERAREILKKNNFSVQTTEVVLVKSPNRPGGLARMLKLLQQENIFIEYMYAFSNSEDTAVIVLRPTDLQRCVDVLQNHRDDFLVQDGQYLF